MMQKQSGKKVSRNQRAGYTLAELLVVLVILGLIMGLVAPRFIGQIGGSKVKIAAAQVENLAAATEFFSIDTGRYPSNSEGLSALVSVPGEPTGWNGPYLKRGHLPVDPWGNPYRYRLLPNGQFEIRSWGADNKEGGEDENRDHVSGS
ncbi:MAG: type II secretion system protein GspG [Robiginitomaculum sp.]|nr:MAG: type II secretion system protein GspG [Robiginitomaculum sp.]